MLQRVLGISASPVPSPVEVELVASNATEISYRELIQHMPIALWQVDARLSGDAMASLRSEGVSDIASYLAAHPELVEYACDAVLVTAVNDAAITLFGGEDETAFLKPVRYLFAETMSAAARVMMAHFERRRNHIEEMKVRTFDGRVLDVLFLVTYPSLVEPQETTFISMLDITNRLRVEAELRKLQADFAHAARVSTLGELVASIAHEVKQPLAAIVMNGETSLRWLSRKEPNLAKVGELAQRMVASASHASEIIQRIQSMAKKQDTVRTALDINAVVEEAILFVRHESKEKRIDITLDLDCSLQGIEGDRIQLQQVVVNLLVNAIQAIDQAGSPKRNIVLRTSSEPGGVVLAIRDTGPGIAEADLEHVFTGFFTTRHDGMGMGLTICQSIISAHRGRIEVTNHPDGGANLRVFIPTLP